MPVICAPTETYRSPNVLHACMSGIGWVYSGNARYNIHYALIFG
jgi:hypothetical protein